MKLEPDKIPLPSGEQDKALWYVQAYLREQLANGEIATCVCCGGTAKVYARALGATMIRVLRAIVEANGEGLNPRDVVRLTLVQSDTGKLAAWGMATKSEKDHRWRATERGRDFLAGKISVPHRVLIYQGDVIGYDHSRLVTVRDVAPDFNLERDVLSAAAVQNAEV